MCSSGGPAGYLNVMSEGSEEFHEGADGKAGGAVAHQEGYVGLHDTEDAIGLGLG